MIGQSAGESVSLSQEHLNFPLAQQHDDGSEVKQSIKIYMLYFFDISALEFDAM